MKLLLDTNALIWLLNDRSGGPLGTEARLLITDADAVYASSVSVLEMRIKVMLGTLEAPDTLLESIAAAGLKDLPFTSNHADSLRVFPTLHRRDPFDRMLLAQAHAENLTFLTADATLLAQDLGFLADARQ